MDKLVDDLLNENRVCDISLPHMRNRDVLEDEELLEPRKSELGSEVDSSDSEDSDSHVSD